MKRLWFSAIFMIAALSLCFAEQFCIAKDCREIIDAIGTAAECDDANEKIEHCKEMIITKKHHISRIIQCCKEQMFQWAH